MDIRVSGKKYHIAVPSLVGLLRNCDYEDTDSYFGEGLVTELCIRYINSPFDKFSIDEIVRLYYEITTIQSSHYLNLITKKICKKISKIKLITLLKLQKMAKNEYLNTFILHTKHYLNELNTELLADKYIPTLLASERIDAIDKILSVILSPILTQPQIDLLNSVNFTDYIFDGRNYTLVVNNNICTSELRRKTYGRIFHNKQFINHDNERRVPRFLNPHTFEKAGSYHKKMLKYYPVHMVQYLKSIGQWDRFIKIKWSEDTWNLIRDFLKKLDKNDLGDKQAKTLFLRNTLMKDLGLTIYFNSKGMINHGVSKLREFHAITKSKELWVYTDKRFNIKKKFCNYQIQKGAFYSVYDHVNHYRDVYFLTIATNVGAYIVKNNKALSKTGNYGMDSLEDFVKLPEHKKEYMKITDRPSKIKLVRDDIGEEFVILEFDDAENYITKIHSIDFDNFVCKTIENFRRPKDHYLDDTTKFEATLKLALIQKIRNKLYYGYAIRNKEKTANTKLTAKTPCKYHLLIKYIDLDTETIHDVNCNVLQNSKKGFGYSDGYHYGVCAIKNNSTYFYLLKDGNFEFVNVVNGISIWRTSVLSGLMYRIADIKNPKNRYTFDARNNCFLSN
ncbi:hypothetical protein [Carp edema virus]|nr:hypothetical protein [Carp edema virus]